MSRQILILATVDTEADRSDSEPEGISAAAYDRLQNALDYAGFTLLRVDPA